MRNGMMLGLFGLSSLLLSGCQTLTPTECRIANWAQMGEQDGSNGRSDRIASHVDGCAQQQVAVSATSVQQYRKGYQQGLQNYCQPEVILDLALNGSGNLSVCPARQQAALRPYAQAGKRQYDTQQAVETLDTKQRKLEAELQNNETTDQRRRDIRLELRRLDRQLIEKRLDANLAEKNLQHLRQQLR